MITNIIEQAMLEYHEHIANRMAEIPVGAILCVHDSTVQNTKLDDWKITFVVESHVVEKEEMCDKQGRKTLYEKPSWWSNG